MVDLLDTFISDYYATFSTVTLYSYNNAHLRVNIRFYQLIKL